MKYIVSWIAFLMTILIILPIALNGASGFEKPEDNAVGYSKNVKVFFHKTNTVKTMPLEEYLFGVVAAEMPASFESEALKSQAVAARTYTLNKIKNRSASDVHKGADICTDFSHCQAYISEEDAVKNWGKNASEYLKKCKNAISETAGEIMIYDDEPVKAVFHSSSSGKTENAKDVWGGDVPYLVSVDSPGEALCPSHKSEVVKTVDEFKKIVLKNYKVDFNEKLIGSISHTDAGAVKTIEIGNKVFKGTEIRSMFGLRSACFNIKLSDDKVVFEVTGNGHGVGMSQYGANYLASKGYEYRQILKIYYTGVEIKNIN